MKKWLTSNEGKKITGIVFILGVALIVQIMGFVGFNHRLYNMTLKDSMEQVENLSVLIEKNIQLELKNYIHILKIAATRLEDVDMGQEEKVVDLFQSIEDVSQFDIVGVADLNGNGIDSTGNYQKIIYDEIWQKIRQEKIYISDVKKDKKGKFIVIAVPLKIDNKLSGVVWGKYKAENILNNMDFDIDNYQYFQVVDKDGHYFMGANAKYTLRERITFTDDTIWKDLNKYEYPDGMSVEKIHNMVQKKESGVFYFEFEGEGRYVNFRPLGDSNWYLFSVQVADELHTFVHHTQKNTIYLFMIFAIGLLIIFGLIYNLIYSMYKQIAKQNREIQNINEMFQITLQETKNTPFIIDYKLKKIIFYSYFEKEEKYRNFEEMDPDKMLEGKYIEKDSLGEYKRLYDNLIIKRKMDESIIIHSKIGDKKEWLRVSVVLNYSKDTDQMIGVMENYGEHKAKDLRIAKHHKDIKKIEEKSQIDFLTKLYNRETFIDKMQVVLDKGNENGAFLILDLDNFKSLNDTMGHGMGDVVLQQVALVLKNFFRDSDLVGRLGGDEFVVFMENIKDINLLENRLSKLNHLLNKNYCKDNKSIRITASIGVVVVDKENSMFNELYEKADQALYQVKNSTRNGFCIYV